MKTDQGLKDVSQDESVTISGKDPGYFTRDLYDAIEKDNYPSWTVYAQIIDPNDAETYPINIFDATRTIPEEDFPLLPFGKITWNGNPLNYFTEVEQAAFAAANIVLGWDITLDPSKSSHGSAPYNVQLL
jgi:catalase